MAGIGDSWGTEEELLHPRGPDGKWIRKAGIAKGIFQRVIDFLSNFRPRSFQSRQQSNQYLQNLSRQSRLQFSRRDYVRMRTDLGSTNADLRDGVIDEPSTKTFVDMMDQHATELPDDIILTRVVPVEAFGFDAQTAVGTDSHSNPGIRGLSGKLAADRGYFVSTIGGVTGTQPPGTVRIIVAAKKGTKVIVPGSSSGDSSIFMDRDQPLRITKIKPDGAGGWTMYVSTDESSGTKEPRVAIGGPSGVGRRPSAEREKEIRTQQRETQRIQATREKRPDDVAEAADEAERRRRFEEGQKDIVPSPMQEAERRRVEQLQQQAGVQPRTEPVVTRSLGGEPRPETAPGGAPQGQAPGAAPEAPAVPRRAVDLRLAVRDAGIPAPSRGPNRSAWNSVYLGVSSGKIDPIDGLRELDSDIAALRRGGEARDRFPGGTTPERTQDANRESDIDALQQLRDLIAKEYGLEQPEEKKAAAPRTKAGLPKLERPEAPAAKKAAKEKAPPPPAKAPAKKATGGLTREQEDRVLDRAKEFRGGPRNEEEQRIVDLADEIQTRRSGGAPVKKAVAKAVPAESDPEQEIKGLFGGKRPTNAQLREMGERNNLGFGPKESRREMILAILGARPSRGRQQGEEPVPAKAPAKKAAPEAPGDDLDKMTKAQLIAEAGRRGITARESWTKDKIKAAFRQREEAGATAPEAPTPAKKAAPRLPVAAPGLLVRLNADFDNPMSRDDAHALLTGSRKAQLLEMARELDIPGASSKTVPELRREIVEATVGRRLDSIATRGFRGLRPESPEVPAPAKKAAKAAVPGAAPGTAAGKITAGRLKPGDRVLVTQNDKGNWIPSTRKTGQTTLEIERIDRVAVRAGRRSGTRLVLVGRDEGGNEIRVSGDGGIVSDRTGVPGHQTFISAPEPGATPAKKATKATAPKRMTIGEARRLSAMEAVKANEITGDGDASYKNIARNLESGDWSVAQARKQAKDTARYYREGAATIRRAGTTGTPEGRKTAADKQERIAAQYERLAGALTVSQTSMETGKLMRGDTPDTVQVARTRQAGIDRSKSYGDLAAEISELTENDVTPEAFRARVASRLQRGGIDPDHADQILSAVETGDRDSARVELARILANEGIHLDAPAGSVVPFDRKKHKGIDGDLEEGSLVHVVRPGYRSRVGDEEIQTRGTVEAASPEDIERVARPTSPVAQAAVPEGSVAGDRPRAPIDNAPRKRTFDEAWDAAELGGEGSPGRSMQEIRQDVSAGRLTPEEGIRRMEEEIAFNKEDLAEVDATLRQQDLTDAQRARLQSDAAKLQNGIEAQERASTFMRMYFRDEKPTVEEIQVSLDEEGYRVLQEATPESLREAAKIAGMDPPKGETKDQILQDMVRQVAEKVIRERGLPAKKVAKKAAKKAAPEAPKIPADREKLDVKVIGAGIEFDDDKWTRDRLDEVQQKLDEGKVTPAQIGRDLDFKTRGLRDHASIQYGKWSDQIDAGGSPPDAEELARRAERDATLQRIRRQADSIEELAERLKKTRRRSAKKAAAPEVQAAETRADTTESRLINDHLERVNKARSREQGDAALEGLTMPELRRIGEQMGIKGRSKREVRDKILDRFFPEVQTPEAKAELEGRQKQTLERLGRQGGVPEAGGKSLSVRAREAGIEPPIRTFSGVDSGVGEADRRLKAGQSPTEVSRFLRERAAQVSKADLNEEGRRFTTEQDKDTLRAIRKQSAEYLRRVATHIQQEGKATPPVKKAAPAAPELPDATKAEIKKLRDHARVTRELAGMRLANNPAGSFHHNRGLQDEKDADRFDAEADALERGGTSAPEAPTAPKVAGPPVRRIHQTEYTPEGKLRLRERPNADEPVYLPNRGNDQGLVHLDSELGELWQDLYRDDREPNSFINEIAHIGEDVGTGKLPLAQALTRLAGMKGRATDPAVADRIQAAIDAMDAPPVELPELPDTVPDAIRRALRRLADIPTARIKGGRMVGLKHRDTSILEDKIDVVRRIDSGEIRRGPEMELMNRDSHESGDGALEMWRIFERLTAPEWVVGYDDQRKPIMEPNPEWPEIQAWLRGARERASARQRS